ncbi:hypothetical protein C8R44DRAFT_771955 [Mycena epipterygia]|nr:hypothetical protein C8R44DRAFT_771955 [Mycena epipterygia]
MVKPVFYVLCFAALVRYAVSVPVSDVGIMIRPSIPITDAGTIVRPIHPDACPGGVCGTY